LVLYRLANIASKSGLVTARLSGKVLEAVGPELVGRVADPPGNALDGGEPLTKSSRVERPAPGVPTVTVHEPR